MINIVGLNKVDILSALGAEAQCVWEAVRQYRFAWKAVPDCWCSIINGVFVIIDLHADDGFDETAYDYALGPGAAQKVIDRLRAEIE